VQKQTGRVVQIGTQQRDTFWTKLPRVETEITPPKFHRQFLLAVAMAHSGRLGNLERVKIVLRANPTCPALPNVAVPSNLNWEMWQGQAPLADYVQGSTSESSNKSFPASRCHYEFRWWYEYSGGKLTDWGAHHVDIAQWAIEMDHSGPVSVEPTVREMPVPYENGYPTVHDKYNCPNKFNITCKFPNGKEIVIASGNEDSMWLEGDKAHIKVNRDVLKDVSGNAVISLIDDPIPEELLTKLCKGKELQPEEHELDSHVANFFECVRDRSLPISDVFTHHRSITTCHLSNIALRLNRPLKWDPDKEEIVGDDEANNWLAREQRKGYEIKV
jgi:hypothetical protein